MSTPTTDATATRHPIARWEWVAICGLLVVAATMRFSFPERLAIEHFDEGVYASNIWFGDRPDRAYPAQHLYAPPLLPALIEWCFVFSGPSNVAAMLPSQVAGTLSVLLLWWLGRSWFGPVAGLVAAALGSTNEVLVLLSRSALTDALLGMWWLAALWALRRACDSGSATDRLAAGLLVGLAWFTKYNGWMPLGIAISAVVLRGAICRGIWGQTKTALASCLIAGAIAFATWSPWLWSLQSKGGYASVAANHRQYIVGLSGWWSSAVRQVEQLDAVRGIVNECLLICGATVFLVIFFWVGVAARWVGRFPNERNEEERQQNILNPILISMPWIGIVFLVVIRSWSPVLFLFAAASQGLLICCLRSLRNSDGRDQPDRTSLGYWIFLVWFGGLLLAAPLYRPYLRLTLPEILASCLGIGFTIQQASNILWKERLTPPISNFAKFPVINCLLIVFLAIPVGMTVVGANLGNDRFRESLFRLIPDQSSLPLAGKAMAANIAAATESSSNEPTPTVVYVYAEPSLLFQLRNAGLQNVAPVSSLQFARTQHSNSDVRIYLAVGIHALSDPRFREQFAAASGQFRRVGRWPWQLGPLVALDQADCDPRLLGHNPAESAAVELYEVLAP
ncbi:MAG: glycosyl transferase family 39 [Planctomycetaceae bacterium]|nr:glycosyl transferase family 39 [Planctomycetaceae bacterium]